MGRGRSRRGERVGRGRGRRGGGGGRGGGEGRWEEEEEEEVKEEEEEEEEVKEGEEGGWGRRGKRRRECSGRRGSMIAVHMCMFQYRMYFGTGDSFGCVGKCASQALGRSEACSGAYGSQDPERLLQYEVRIC